MRRTHSLERPKTVENHSNKQILSILPLSVLVVTRKDIAVDEEIPALQIRQIPSLVQNNLLESCSSPFHCCTNSRGIVCVEPDGFGVVDIQVRWALHEEFCRHVDARVRRRSCLRHQDHLMLRACPTKIACSRVVLSATTCLGNDVQHSSNFLISPVATSVRSYCTEATTTMTASTLGKRTRSTVEGAGTRLLRVFEMSP